MSASPDVKQGRADGYAHDTDGAGARAMAALSRTVTAADKAGTGSAPPPPADHEQPEPDELESLRQGRICRTDSASDRIVASLQRVCRAAPPEGRMTAEALADLADAVLADSFAARQARQRVRR